MSTFSLADSRRIVEALPASQSSLTAAFADTFGGQPTLDVGDLQVLTDDAPDAWDGPGLVFSLEATGGSVQGLLPARLLPQWCQAAETLDEAVLSRFADQLSALFPEPLSVRALGVEFTSCLTQALHPGTSNHDRNGVAITVDSGEISDGFWLVWQVAPAENDAAAAGAQSPSAADETTTPGGKQLQYETLEDGIRQLPPYARSLLKVRVPVRVTLATSKVPLVRVLDLGHGSILQFQKSCEEPLTLEAGDQEIASGEAVKVGDKFGIWITSITMPEERFWVLKGGQPTRVK